MSRISYQGARTGRRARTGSGGLINQFEWEMGDRKRLVLPVVNGSIVLLAKPYHPVAVRGAITMTKSNGQGTYSIDKVRCTHVNSQATFEDSYKLAKIGEPCVFCQVALHEERRKWDTLRAAYTPEQFAALTTEEKKTYFNEITANDTVEASYYSQTLADGTSQYSTHFDIYALAMELSVDGNGQVILEDVDGQMVPKYNMVLLPASKARLDKFKTAVDNALLSGTIQRNILHPYVENVNTPAEEEVLIGWVDFLVTFPMKAQKMESGKDMAVTPMASTASVVTPDLLAHFAGKADMFEKEAENTFDRLFVNLQVHTADEAKGMFVSGAAYVEELSSVYRKLEDYTSNDGHAVLSDVLREQNAFAKVIESYEKYATPEVTAEQAPAQVATPPVQQAAPAQVATPPVQAPPTQVAPPPVQQAAPMPEPPPLQAPQLTDEVFDI